MIEVTNLYKRYGQIEALKSVSFSIQKGEIVGFLGPNGAGKTTTMNILTGYLSYNSGHVKITGQDIIEHPVEFKKNIGYLPEDPPLYTDMTVTEYLGFVHELKKLPAENKKKEIDRVLQVTQTTDVCHRRTGNLSRGYRQRVGLAQALLGDPQVLIFDEPTSGLDPAQIIEIRALLRELGKEHTVILSSHILPEIRSVCERLIIITEGTIVADGSVDQIRQDSEKTTNLLLVTERHEDALMSLLHDIEGVTECLLDAPLTDNEVRIIIKVNKGSDVRKAVFNAMVENSYPILELATHQPSLEEMFVRVTMGGTPAITKE